MAPAVSRIIAVILAFAGWVGGQEPTATVYIYRPKSMVGLALRPSIYCDGMEIGRLHSGRFFATQVSPGKHLISAGRSEVGHFVDMELGRQYYFRLGHKNWAMTSVSGRQPITLEPVREDEAKREMHGLKDGKESQ